MMAALLCALLCTLMGWMQYKKYHQDAHHALLFLQALEKMAAEMRFTVLPLPELMKKSAPDAQHFLFRLGRMMETHPALPPDQLLQKAGMPAELPLQLQAMLQKLFLGLHAPEDAFRQRIMEDTLQCWKEETEKLQAVFRKKGPLSLQLSLLLGCALFILFC